MDVIPLYLRYFHLFLFSPCRSGSIKKTLDFQHVTKKDGLSSEMVNAIAVQGDQVWFGTEGGGATLFDRAKKTWRAYTTKGEPEDKVDRGRASNGKTSFLTITSPSFFPMKEGFGSALTFTASAEEEFPTTIPGKSLRGRSSAQTTEMRRRLFRSPSTGILCGWGPRRTFLS